MVYLDKNYLLLEKEKIINYFNFTPLLYPLGLMLMFILKVMKIIRFSEITNLPLTINTGKLIQIVYLKIFSVKILN